MYFFANVKSGIVWLNKLKQNCKKIVQDGIRV